MSTEASVLLSGILVFVTAISTQLVQYWLLRRREQSAKAIELRNKVYGELCANLHSLCHTIPEYAYGDLRDGPLITITPALQRAYNWGNLLAEIEKNLSQCILLAGSKLLPLLEELEAKLPSRIMTLSTEFSFKEDGYGPTELKPLIAELGEIIFRFRKETSVYEGLRRRILTSMREELRFR